MIKKYLQFIKEAEEQPEMEQTTETDVESTDNKEIEDSSDFSELSDEIKSMIEKTVENMGGEYDDFKDKLIKNPEDTKIEGLINDSDIYDFYLKYRGYVDEMLNDIKFYDEIPSEMNVFGLYEYIIIGTMRAVNECVKNI
jgi:hypothetical protein